jgi:hypothetical protein
MDFGGETAAWVDVTAWVEKNRVNVETTQILYILTILPTMASGHPTQTIYCWISGNAMMCKLSPFLSDANQL